ncbi:MAG TPA: cytochrome c [Acidimicrobiia bacterium]|nr:cytochrome c [Acidimicrobiia bacterium]
MSLKRIVDVLQLLTLAATVWTLTLLFVSQPSMTGDPVQDLGARIYAARCSGCHGGSGQGLTGPPLAGQMVERFPDPADQAAVIARGRAGMPAFGGRLSAEELAAVVEFTRSSLGT